MNPSAPVHLEHVWACLDCGRYGNDSRRCWACASTTVHPVEAWIERKKEKAA